MVSADQLLKNQIIHKAWEDPSFKERLLSNPKAAIKELLGISIPDHVELTTQEETKDHFILVIPPNPAEILPTDNVRRFSGNPFFLPRKWASLSFS
ncbi:NHLP leader peptide domain protein [Paenibacillus alvei DSM 29]|uniref:NHLP leader peptide family RiPP precursor n=1 Tax=Paenibacillus alvei TaxID=44250 RepID=UPI00028842B3|nr:NHLP leader peptide family RiPP precursor [Paenibacillus alvei]EJW19251.1 NHLP leader peptide domain protein [Paenibacillus alvei DSM 29]